MKTSTCLTAGIFGIAIIAGIFEALASPRKKEEPGEGKREEEGKAKVPASACCDSL